MVSKITIFEPHFDGAQIGPATIGGNGESSTDESAANGTTSRGTGRRRAGVVVGVGLLASLCIYGLFAVRRRRGVPRAGVEDENRPVTEVAST